METAISIRYGWWIMIFYINSLPCLNFAGLPVVCLGKE